MNVNERRFPSAAVLAIVLAPAIVTGVYADVTTTAVREAVEYVTKKFAKEAAEEGAETLARKLETAAAKYGDDALTAARKAGPQALRAAEEAGVHGAQAMRAVARFGDDGLVWVARKPKSLELVARYGDDAAEVLVKHKGIAEDLVSEAGEAAIKALKAVDTPNAIRLAQMAETPATAALARNPQLLEVVGKYGDRAMQFIWSNKGALVVTAGLAAFLADPQPFLDGTRDLAAIVGENVVKPIVEIPGAVAKQAAGRMDWTVVAIVVVMVAALGLVWRSYWRHRAEMRRATTK